MAQRNRFYSDVKIVNGSRDLTDEEREEVQDSLSVLANSMVKSFGIEVAMTDDDRVRGAHVHESTDDYQCRPCRLIAQDLRNSDN